MTRKTSTHKSCGSGRGIAPEREDSDDTAVLFLLNSLQIGGSEVKTVRMANALHQKGRPVHLGCLNLSEGPQDPISESLPVIDFGRRGKFDPKVLSRISEYTRIHRIRKLLCVNLYPTLYGVLFQSMRPGRHIEAISCVNVTDFASRGEALKMLIYRHALRKATKIVFGCENQKEKWVGKYGLDSKCCMHIYNGVDIERFSSFADAGKKKALREGLGFSENDLLIVSVAQFRPGKQQEDLIAACSLLVREARPVRLVLVGDGPERARLQNMVEEQGASDRVVFCGQLSDVRPMLEVCDIFALSSVAVETFSNSALEAMAMGKPVVISDIGGASEMVREGISGFLYPPGDVEALARKLTLLVKDGSAREGMGLEARKEVREHFGFDAMVQNYEQLLFPPVSTLPVGTEEYRGQSLTNRLAMPSRKDGHTNLAAR